MAVVVFVITGFLCGILAAASLRAWQKLLAGAVILAAAWLALVIVGHDPANEPETANFLIALVVSVTVSSAVMSAVGARRLKQLRKSKRHP